ncbi:hypothetical protein Tco_0027386, partial [Tanacetum coccineum]
MLLDSEESDPEVLENKKERRVSLVSGCDPRPSSGLRNSVEFHGGLSRSGVSRAEPESYGPKGNSGVHHWHLQSEFDIRNCLSGSLMDFFEGFTYEHVNFIFSDVTYPQDSIQSTINTNNYKFAYSEPGNFSYYDYCDAYAINGETYENSGFTRQSENASTAANERSTAVPMQTDGHS